MKAFPAGVLTAFWIDIESTTSTCLILYTSHGLVCHRFSDWPYVSKFKVEALYCTYWDDNEAVVLSHEAHTSPPTYAQHAHTPALDDDGMRICPHMAQLAQYNYYITAVGACRGRSSGATPSGMEAAPHPTPSLGLPVFPGSRPSPRNPSVDPFWARGMSTSCCPAN